MGARVPRGGAAGREREERQGAWVYRCDLGRDNGLIRVLICFLICLLMCVCVCLGWTGLASTAGADEVFMKLKLLLRLAQLQSLLTCAENNINNNQAWP